MRRQVNLLCWREQRRRECLRLWGVLFIGVLLIALALIIAGRVRQSQQHTWLALRQESDQVVRQMLTRQEQRLREDRERGLVAQRREQQRALTLRWQTTLLTLAEKMPAQAWLTALEWQGDALRFSGLANRFPTLTQVEIVARSLPGFGAVTPGATRRDEQGRWQFSYQLQTEAVDAEVR
ncbi:fimbrial assembly protein [Scandinavium sp. H11S7]|uniref:PilN domain-containing protein n=1 Tax=Scandinavium hiltneri TaxID=2926519 RepID=UPI002165D617|nr:fimbrial assembly protein [Scandinavium hiltneri]MCS2157395.1 fimbrial assembly protein [Scandinavium hiltneri]